MKVNEVIPLNEMPFSSALKARTVPKTTEKHSAQRAEHENTIQSQLKKIKMFQYFYQLLQL